MPQHRSKSAEGRMLTAGYGCALAIAGRSMARDPEDSRKKRRARQHRRVRRVYPNKTGLVQGLKALN